MLTLTLTQNPNPTLTLNTNDARHSDRPHIDNLATTLSLQHISVHVAELQSSQHVSWSYQHYIACCEIH